jgi:hypothetical protein
VDTKENGDISQTGEPNPNNAVVNSSVDAGENTAPTVNLISEEEEDNDQVVIRLPTVTDVYFVIIDCTTMAYVDSVGVKVLQQVCGDEKLNWESVHFCRMGAL